MHTVILNHRSSYIFIFVVMLVIIFWKTLDSLKFFLQSSELFYELNEIIVINVISAGTHSLQYEWDV
jgi:hypothetical protein